MKQIELVAVYSNAVSAKTIYSEEALAEAEAAGAKIHVIDEETGNPGELLFDGEKWVKDKPIAVKDTSLDVAIPRADYVDAVTNLFQVEMEAIVNEIEPESAQVRTMGVGKKLSSLREIMLAGRQALEAQDIDVVTETTEKIREATNGTARS